PGPSPRILIAVPPPTPAPDAVPILLQPALGSAQASHPCAPEPAPSPSHSIRWLPLATTAGPFSPPPAVTGAAPAAVGQGGQRQPAVPRTRTASPPTRHPNRTGRGARACISWW